MPNASKPGAAFFARGIDTVTTYGGPIQSAWPELVDFQRLAPNAQGSQTQLAQLLAGHALDREINTAIRPAVTDAQLLLPRPFSRALESAMETIERVVDRHGRSDVLERAQRILIQEHEWRELARTYRDALHQA
jgi:hypothetical protein